MSAPVAQTRPLHTFKSAVAQTRPLHTFKSAHTRTLAMNRMSPLELFGQLPVELRLLILLAFPNIFVGGQNYEYTKKNEMRKTKHNMDLWWKRKINSLTLPLSTIFLNAHKLEIYAQFVIPEKSVCFGKKMPFIIMNHPSLPKTFHPAYLGSNTDAIHAIFYSAYVNTSARLRNSLCGATELSLETFYSTFHPPNYYSRSPLPALDPMAKQCQKQTKLKWFHKDGTPLTTLF